MKNFAVASILIAGSLSGCALQPAVAPVAGTNLPDCFESNYDRVRDLFTLNSGAGNAANQQCLLKVWPAGSIRSATRVTAGAYAVYLADGGGGGAGGTVQGAGRDGGGGGGGAGAREMRTAVNLREGLYVLTIGAGGPGGSACMPKPFAFGGGPGWAGSPSDMVFLPDGKLVAGSPGAAEYVRPTRAKNEGTAGQSDGHGGSGLGQASGGHGAYTEETIGARVDARPGQGKSGLGGTASGGGGGETPTKVGRSGAGGGGGATSFAEGGEGGGELAGRRDVPPERGQLGSGGGGGEGNSSECDQGGAGGHGYIALRPM